MQDEFGYNGGSVPRPWEHFDGRWKAIGSKLANIFGVGDDGMPFRLLDVGSNHGYFSLQAAAQHPRAEVVGIEGSVGVGNGKMGLEGGTDAILGTHGVQTHLHWAGRLGLHNCWVVPEVWDYARVKELTSDGCPICDVLLLLSVVHHIDRLSAAQYAEASMSGLQGFMDLLAKTFILADVVFIELPGQRDLRSAFRTYATPEKILRAAAAASGRQWQFAGPLYAATWFGNRELWQMQVERTEPHASPRPLDDLFSARFNSKDVQPTARSPAELRQAEHRLRRKSRARHRSF